MMDGDSEKNRYSSSNFEEDDMGQQQMEQMGTGDMEDMNENFLDPMEAIEEEEETLGANPT